MNFEFLVEDQSSKEFLQILLPKIIDENNTFKIHSYKGIGRLPKNDKKPKVPKKVLLSKLPEILNGYGNTYKNENKSENAVITVCDLDNNKLNEFKRSLAEVLKKCRYKPNARFCFAIEEIEAWLMGDITAVQKAYPKTKLGILKKYKNDSICGTWERLADAIYPGGSKKLINLGYPQIGNEKAKWAREITPHIDLSNNQSPSFNDFIKTIKNLIDLNKRYSRIALLKK